jgi:hypothetical protein
MNNRDCPSCSEVLTTLQSSGRMVCRSCGWVGKPIRPDSENTPSPDANLSVKRNSSSTDMGDEAIYVSDNVKVTKTRFIVGETTYAIRNITSVKMTIEPSSSGCAITVIVVGVIFVISGIGIFLSNPGPLMYAGLILAWGISWLRSCKIKYNVFIVSASGENRALTSTNKGYIADIVDSINDAIVMY